MKQTGMLFLLCLFLFTGCNKRINDTNPSDITEKKKVEESENSMARLKEYFQNYRANDIYLVAAKYDIDHKIIRKLIAEYEEMVSGFTINDLAVVFDSNQQSTGTVKEIKDVNTTLGVLSKKYNISKRIIASIVIDYKSLESSQCSSNNSRE